jgi:CRISPR-associated endonuclease/helicase Cas3
VAEEHKLRHVFVVLPYITIIKQAVRVYREALVLAGENPEDIVAEHDHQADFSEPDARYLASLWRAPIIVTTAVQFFETLAASHPARLRKLHELPGSALFLDEAHAALPSHLWRQVWQWFQEWVTEWGGHTVLASGSLARFWQDEEFVEPALTEDDVPDLLPPDLRTRLQTREVQRVRVRTTDKVLTLAELTDFVRSKAGPRLIILNTVQSAAVVAQHFRQAGADVLHLSTALTPPDRARILDLVSARLNDPNHDDWTLVATSLVEAGVDVSFRTGFRERSSAASVIQVSGRVNREGRPEWGIAEVWDFRVSDVGLNSNPGFEVPRKVVMQLMDLARFDTGTASEIATEAMYLEMTQGHSDKADAIVQAESAMDYPKVARLCQVIDADSRFVIIDNAVADAIEAGRKVERKALINGSVQIFASRVKRLPVRLISGEDGAPGSIYVWCDHYDSDFLGYMSGVISALGYESPIYYA